MAALSSSAATEALRAVLRRVHQASERCGREAEQIRVVAVSKTKPVAVIRQLYDSGHRAFASRGYRVAFHREFAEQQTGVPNLAFVESVDDEKIANRLNSFVESLGRKPLKVFLQVNTSGEESKSGVEPSGCVELARFVTQNCPNLEFCGLMTIGMLDYTSTPENFKTLADCRTNICKALGMPEDKCELSMGMSSDFEQAIEMGSTNVRIGSVIFGPREYPKKAEH